MPLADSELNNLNTYQSPIQQGSRTIASAATIAPTTRYSRITGSTPVVNITPPTLGYHELVFDFANATANALNTGGNIATAYTAIVDRPITVYYNPQTAQYKVMSVA